MSSLELILGGTAAAGMCLYGWRLMDQQRTEYFYKLANKLYMKINQDPLLGITEEMRGREWDPPALDKLPRAVGFGSYRAKKEYEELYKTYTNQFSVDLTNSS